MRISNLIRWLAPGFLLLGLCPALDAPHADVIAYQIIPDGEGNRVEFLSKAPLESFKGHTGRVRGEVTCDPAQLGDSVAVVIEVDLASLTTGMKLRDQHMRENHLETDQFPHAVFQGASVLPGSAAQLPPGETAKLELAGSFELHGRRLPLEITARVTRQDEAGGDGLLIECDFPVKLSDYQIKRPKFLVMKLGDTQQVSVRLLARPVSGD